MQTVVKAWADENVGKSERFDIGLIDALWTQRYAIAIDDLNPVYFDDERAKACGYKGIIAPPNYVTTLRHSVVPGPPESELLEDGMSPKAKPPIPGLQAMGGGQELEFHDPVYCGERITGERTIKNVNERESKAGPLIIILDEIRYSNTDGELKVVLRNTLLCRWIENSHA